MCISRNEVAVVVGKVLEKSRRTDDLLLPAAVLALTSIPPVHFFIKKMMMGFSTMELSQKAMSSPYGIVIMM